MTVNGTPFFFFFFWAFTFFLPLFFQLNAGRPSLTLFSQSFKCKTAVCLFCLHVIPWKAQWRSERRRRRDSGELGCQQMLVIRWCDEGYPARCRREGWRVSSRGSPEHVQTIHVLWLFQAKSSVLRTQVVYQCCQYAELLGSRSECKCKMLITTIKCNVNGSSNEGPARPFLSRHVDSVEPQSLQLWTCSIFSLSPSAFFPLPDSSLCSHSVSFNLLYYKVHALWFSPLSLRSLTCHNVSITARKCVKVFKIKDCLNRQERVQRLIEVLLLFLHSCLNCTKHQEVLLLLLLCQRWLRRWCFI